LKTTIEGAEKVNTKVKPSLVKKEGRKVSYAGQITITVVSGSTEGRRKGLSRNHSFGTNPEKWGE